MKPYVYIIQNIEKTHWYVGMRSANVCPANEDTGYWGSSKYLKALIKQTRKDQWTKTIVAEFDTATEAHEYEQHLIKSMWDLPGRVNKGMSGFVDHDDQEVKVKHLAGIAKRNENPEYRANHKAAVAIASKKRSENPEWIANHTAAMQELAQDPVWQANHKAASQKRAQDPVCRENHKAAMQKKAKPFIATSIATGEEFYCENLNCDQAKALELNPGNVSNCLNGRYKQTKSFTFRYV